MYLHMLMYMCMYMCLQRHTYITKSMYVVIHACMSICTCACMYVDVFVCFCVHNHIFASMRARVSEHIHARVFIYGFAYRNACTHVRVSSQMYPQNQRGIETYIEKLIPKGVEIYCTFIPFTWTHMRMHMRMHMIMHMRMSIRRRMNLCMYACVHVCMYECTIFCVHRCIHTCTHVCACACLCRESAAVFEIERG